MNTKKNKLKVLTTLAISGVVFSTISFPVSAASNSDTQQKVNIVVNKQTSTNQTDANGVSHKTTTSVNDHFDNMNDFLTKYGNGVSSSTNSQSNQSSSGLNSLFGDLSGIFGGTTGGFGNLSGLFGNLQGSNFDNSVGNNGGDLTNSTSNDVSNLNLSGSNSDDSVSCDSVLNDFEGKTVGDLISQYGLSDMINQASNGAQVPSDMVIFTPEVTAQAKAMCEQKEQQTTSKDSSQSDAASQVSNPVTVQNQSQDSTSEPQVVGDNQVNGSVLAQRILTQVQTQLNQAKVQDDKSSSLSDALQSASMPQAVKKAIKKAKKSSKQTTAQN